MGMLHVQDPSLIMLKISWSSVAQQKLQYFPLQDAVSWSIMKLENLKKAGVILGGILWNISSRSDIVMPLSESFLSKGNFRRASQPDIVVHSFPYLSLN